MMRYRRWSARPMIVALLLAVSLACGAQPPSGPVTSAPPTAVANSAVPRAELGTAINDYLAHGSANLQVLVSRRGELLAERYYNSDVAEYLEIHSATKDVISTLVGIALTNGDLKSLNQTVGELLPQHRSAMSKSSARTSVPSFCHMITAADRRAVLEPVNGAETRRAGKHPVAAVNPHHEWRGRRGRPPRDVG
jgi:hypothetical protein